VGRLIRRATVEVKDGITTVTNPYEAQKTEFIRSSDPYFRPLNMTTGPDGCLYIVDTYRGIIQEGNWVKPGSFLRGAIEPTGMQHVVGRGRVWRLVHKDFKPGPQPKMLSETPAQLVAHLTHPNGWSARHRPAHDHRQGRSVRRPRADGDGVRPTRISSPACTRSGPWKASAASLRKWCARP